MENYIDRHIIQPLYEGLCGGRDFSYYQSHFERALSYCRERGAMGSLTSKMQPLYEKYFFAHPSIIGNNSYNSYFAKRFILQVMQDDYDFFYWIQDNDNLLDSAHMWAKSAKEGLAGSYDYLLLLQAMSATFYSYTYITPYEQLRKILAEERGKGHDYRSREIYCMLYAFIAIWRDDSIGKSRKVELFALVVEHWSFIRHLFSAMLQSLVGWGVPEFASLIRSVKRDRQHIAYAHHLYAAVEEHKERIVQNGTKRHKLESAMDDLREVMVHTEPSSALDEVVSIIFSDRLKVYLLRHQPKSYRELEAELNTLRKGMDERTNRIQSLMSEQAEMLRQMVSIDAITEELLRLPVGTAYGVYEKLNSLLQTDEAWRKNADAIRERILNKEQSTYTQLNINAPVGTLVAHADKIVNEN